MSIPGSAEPLLLAQQDTGYKIERSIRLNAPDSAYLSRTPASAGNRKTWTWSGWVKRSAISASRQAIFTCTNAVATLYTGLEFNASEGLTVYDTNAAGGVARATTAVYRDVAAWYHVLLAYDTTSATADDRIKLYVNGSEVTVFSTKVNPTQNSDAYLNSAVAHSIGSWSPAAALFLNGYLADVHFIDGQALTPSSFGEFDTNGVWQPKAYSGSYGTNGFRLDFSDNSAATATTLGADRSGNGNNWTPINLTAGPAFTSNSWSGYFDGTGDYLTVPNNAAWDFGTGNFTIETWVYPTTSGTQRVIGSAFSSAGSLGWSYELTSANLLTFYAQGAFRVTSTGSIPANTWTHVAVSRSGTSLKLFINGVTDGSVTDSTNITGSTGTATIAGTSSGTGLFTGYQSNFRIVTGTAVYTANFTPATTPLTAITNTSLLALQSSTFVDNSANNFTITKFGDARVDYRSPFEDPVDTDSLVDSPTNYGSDTGAGGEVRGNYCTWNPLASIPGYLGTLSNGNLESVASGNNRIAYGTFAIPSSGKWYFEVTTTGSPAYPYIGVATYNGTSSAYPQDLVSPSLTYYGPTGQKDIEGTYTTYGASYSNATIGIAVNVDGSEVTFYKDGVSQGAISKSVVGALPFVSTAGGSGTFILNAGQRPFAYTAPSGFKALCTQNLPTPTILQGSTAMDVKLYTGNGSTQTISGLGFSPDLVWLKNRASAYGHAAFDSVRGTGSSKGLRIDSASFEGDPAVIGDYANLTAFNSDGFILGTTVSINAINTNNQAHVAWTWDAGSSTVTNTAGSISSQVRANASAGFSVVTYTGNLTSAGSVTVGHGLGVAPSLVITKSRSNTSRWVVQHKDLGTNAYLELNTTSATSDSTSSGGLPKPTSTVFYTAWLAGSNINGENFVAYAFAPVAGYSAFGSYVGNGSADGPMVWTGFRPRFLLCKMSSSTSHWYTFDSERDPYNAVDKVLYPSLSNAEASGTPRVDFLSNGFKVVSGASDPNVSGTWVFAAFAEHPFQTSRAR